MNNNYTPELPEWPEYLTDDQLARHLAIHERGRQTEEDTVERLRGELRRRDELRQRDAKKIVSRQTFGTWLTIRAIPKGLGWRVTVRRPQAKTIPTYKAMYCSKTEAIGRVFEQWQKDYRGAVSLLKNFEELQGYASNLTQEDKDELKKLPQNLVDLVINFNQADAKFAERAKP